LTSTGAAAAACGISGWSDAVTDDCLLQRDYCKDAMRYGTCTGNDVETWPAIIKTRMNGAPFWNCAAIALMLFTALGSGTSSAILYMCNVISRA